MGTLGSAGAGPNSTYWEGVLIAEFRSAPIFESAWFEKRSFVVHVDTAGYSG